MIYDYVKDEHPAMMTVIMRAGDIPEYSTVCKKTGNKPHNLRKSVKVYSENTTPFVLSDDSVRYIVDDRGNVSAISVDKEIAWHVEYEELYQFLDSFLHTGQ